MTENGAVALMLGAIGAALFGGAVQALLVENSRPIAFVAAGVGLLMIVLSAFFSKFSVLIPTALLTSARVWATDFRVWFGMFAALWLYSTSTSLLATWRLNGLTRVVEQQILPFQYAIERWVAPRRLTPEQMAVSRTYLEEHRQPCIVRFEVREDDSEAEAFATDLHRTLAHARWNVVETVRLGKVPEGLGLHMEEPVDRPANTQPNQAVMEAFRRVGVTFDQGSSGSRRDLADTTLTIRVGARKRDALARPVRMAPQEVK